MKKLFLAIAKPLVVFSFVTTLFATYFMRSEMLSLNKLRYAAEKMNAEFAVKEAEESFPQKLQRHEVELKNYRLQIENFEKQLKLYQTDYEAYVRTNKSGSVQPPKLPFFPDKPRPPSYRQEILQLQSQFRGQQLDYYSKSQTMNWILCASAMLLTGSLVFLILFETGAQKIAYLAVLVVSFVFMIGPSFHSILTALIGILEPPR